MTDETKGPLKGTFFDDFSFQETTEKTKDDLKTEVNKTTEDKIIEKDKLSEKKESNDDAQKLIDDTDNKSTEEFDILATTLKEKKENELEEDEKEFLKNYEAGTLDEYKEKTIEKEASKEEGFEALTKTLIAEGILTATEELEDTAESLNAAISNTVETKVDEYLAEIPEEYRTVIDHMRTGGDVNSYLQSKATIDYKNLDLENVEIQKTLVKADLEQQEYSVDEIEEKLKDYEDLEKLQKEATKVSKKFDKAQTQRLIEYDEAITASLAKQEAEALTDIDEVKKDIDSMEEIAGFKLTKKRKEDFKKYLFDIDKNGETAASRTQKDNENRIKAHFMGFIGYNFSDLEKSVISKKSKDINKILSRYKDTQSVSKGIVVKDKNPDPEFKLNIPTMFNRSSDE